MRSWIEQKRWCVAQVEGRTPEEGLIAMNMITISATCVKEPRRIYNKENKTYYWSLELWEPGIRVPFNWKIHFPSGLFDKELEAISLKNFVSVVGYIANWFVDEYVDDKGDKKQKLVLIINGTDIFILRKRGKKVET